MHVTWKVPCVGTLTLYIDVAAGGVAPVTSVAIAIGFALPISLWAHAPPQIRGLRRRRLRGGRGVVL